MKEKGIVNEKAALEKLIDGDQQAFTYLYNYYAEKVYYFALGLVRSEERAENITQEVFLKIWETRGRIDPDNAFNSYLFTITRNTLYNQHRKSINERAYLDYIGRAFESALPTTEQDISLKELQERIDSCVSKLPPQRKKVFELSRMEGLSHKEISARMGIAEKTIATHIRLALQTLRKCLR